MSEKTNLFEQSMTEQTTRTIANLKRNKNFIARLHRDLSQVYHTYPKFDDEQKETTINMKSQSNYNYYSAATFYASSKEAYFTIPTLTYYGKIKELFKKYVDESNFKDVVMDDDLHTHFSFKIPLAEDDKDLNKKLKDIIYLMDLNGYVNVY